MWVFPNLLAFILFLIAGHSSPTTLDKNGATKACNSLGWSVTWTSSASLICTAPGTTKGKNCNKCNTWRLFVWKDGGTDQSANGQTYGTKAGKSYGGHSPCKGGWNLPECTEPWNVQYRSTCVDKHKNCPGWAQGGHCRKTKVYMEINCRLSCKLCTKGRQVSGKTHYLIKNDDCWVKCNRGGSCPGFCGVDGYCCRKGYSDCPKLYADVSPDHHKCVRGNPSKVVTRWSSWGAWGDCNKSCGRGTTWRSRTCNNYGGEACVGQNKQSGYCNSQKCTILVPKTPINAEHCGETITGRIVGGEAAAYGKWPWQIGLVRRNNERFVFCGGTLINTRTVLTAAHCFRQMNPHGKYYSVRVGDLNLDVVEDGEEIVKVKRIIKHQGYIRHTKAHDIAIMILEKDVTEAAACVAVGGNVPAVGDKCFITGWGRVKEGGKLSSVLKEAKVPIVSTGACRAVYGVKITNGTICAGYQRGGIDTCSGDSGGPMVCKSSNGKHVLHGITSFGAGCAKPGIYGVYTKVSAYEKWIKDALR